MDIFLNVMNSTQFYFKIYFVVYFIDIDSDIL